MKTNYYGVFIAVALLAAPFHSIFAAEPAASSVLYLWPDRAVEQDAETVKNNVRLITVRSPALAVYRPAATNGPVPAVMICPGGGYSVLGIDLEGTEIAAWLNSLGYAAVVLKYTVPNNRDAALQDAQRAMGLIRKNSAAWGIDPARLGVMGFSAGGHLAARLSTTCTARSYPAVDEADQLSCRPDFTVLIYPAYLGDKTYTLPAEIAVTTNTPPAFIFQTQDDRRYVDSSITYYLTLKKQNIPSELHLLPSGGHGYGLRRLQSPAGVWPELCGAWLQRAVSNQPPAGP